MSLFFKMLGCLCGLGWLQMAQAQVISPSAVEIAFRYSSEFITRDTAESEQAQAQDHSRFLFGVLHSPSMVLKFGLNPELLEGLGGVRQPPTIKIQNVSTNEKGQTVISYQAFGRMLLHKSVALQLQQTHKLQLLLPYDYDKVYLKKCTDAHYSSWGDYWYFWDPYRDGCQRLHNPLITREVTLHLTAITAVPSETTPNLGKLRGDNGNGQIFSVYILNGFNEGSANSEDEGRLNFQQITELFRERGFAIETLNRNPRIPRNRYSKRLSASVTVEVIHQLSNTSIDDEAMTFPKIFKEAVEKGDIIAYLGHSGLGGNLDIPSLNDKLAESGEGPIRFTDSKYQIFFFDSCSSYSYYLPSFRALKPKSKIDILSYGLSSLFESSHAVFSVFVDQFLNLGQPRTWQQILRSMEKPLGEQTFLLNVGGV